MTTTVDTRAGGPAIITYHCAVYGIRRQQVRAWKVGDVGRYAQHDRAVGLRYVEPRKRNWRLRHVVPTSIEWVTIETPDGQQLYDSREDVPCDMDVWNERYERHASSNPMFRHGEQT